MPLIVRTYRPSDYAGIAELYRQGDLYGGQFSDARDAEDRLARRIQADAESILVAESNGRLAGTVSLIEDARVAWLFRFAVLDGEESATVRQALYDKASTILRDRGHAEVLVYAPSQERFDNVYSRLGFNKGGTYTCFWREL